MADGIYSALSGALARSTHLDVVANNLANAATTGFKADRVTFAEKLAKASGSAAGESFAVVGDVATDLAAGPLMSTGNPLDVALDEGAFLTVETPRGERFTRDGRLALGPGGLLVTSSGLPVLDGSGRRITVAPGAAAAIDADGTLRADGDALARL